MLTADLDYELPNELIAQFPPEQRRGSRLLEVARHGDDLRDLPFTRLPELLVAGDLLVLNNTRVVPARFHLLRASGGRIEGLWLNCSDSGHWEVLLRGAGRLKIGEVLSFEADPRITARLVARGMRGAHTLDVQPDADPRPVLQRVGSMPLPHYIHRGVQTVDQQRYQTVYARNRGAVAAPTAGLHFDEDLLAELRRSGVDIVEVTLHVGIGTFQPIEVEDLNDHVMHRERYDVDPRAWAAIASARHHKRRIVAVGTTTVRVLESVVRNEQLTGWTDLFIQPPFEFRMVDALLTNFHLPRSTLLAMVYAFGGTETMQRAYAHAVRARYRFFSYGDSMLIE